MTTVAFDGKTLAVDRASWKNSYTWTKVNKLYKVKICQEAAERLAILPDTDVVAAFAGVAGDISLILRWMERGGEVPELREKDISRGLLLSRTEEGKPVVLFLTSILTTEPPIEEYPVADGGGFEMALGAMLAGATATEAIRLISKRSSWAAGGITSYDFETDVIVEYDF